MTRVHAGVLAASAAALALASLLVAQSGPATEARTGPVAKTTRVVLLGTGTPNAEPDRSGSAVAVVANNSAYIVDCGPGVVRRANAAAARGITALEPAKLGTVFITHLHSDHTLGLPDLMLTPWTLGRTDPLRVYGPRGVAAMTARLLEAYRLDIENRLSGLEPANTTGYRVDAHEIGVGEVYKDANVTVRAFTATHGAWEQAFGFRFEAADGTVVVISGDTTPAGAVIENCAGCDVLVHEVYSQAGFEKRPKEWQAYHAKSHTSGPELAAIASKAKPKLLVLYHQLLWSATEDDLLREIRRGYQGRVVYGRDLDVF
jgi:ribonuclease BN (tRNA processing enzyme)